MDVGLILIATILFLGGMIATVGDRIGMRVGKSRLSLFNLRPRQTATLVSILTGSVISASTLGLLLVASEQLRKSLFEFEEIQSNLAQARQSLTATETAKADIEAALSQVTKQKTRAETGLRRVNESLKDAVARQQETQARLRQIKGQLDTVSEQALTLRTEINRLQQERQTLLQRQQAIRAQIAGRDREIEALDQALAQRNQEIAQRNQEIGQRNQEIAQRQAELDRLETQQVLLTEEIQRLEVEFVKLRAGNVAISRNQTLALLITRPESVEAATREVEQALIEANRVALRAILPDSEDNRQILRISPTTVDTVINQLLNGNNYVVRVAALGNYIVGEPCVLEATEPCVQIDLQARINRIVFDAGEVIAKIAVEDIYSPPEVLVDKLQTLLATAQVKANLEGVIIIDNPQVAGGLSEPVIEFIKDVQTYGAPLQIEAVAARPIFTTGPLFLDLVATENDQVIFRTNLK